MQLKKLVNEIKHEQALAKINLFEHKVYKAIPGTKTSFRTDPGKTNTRTIKHAHTYAKLDGKGKELYSVNIDGTGHDGNSGVTIPQTHADFFRELGYDINSNNILEVLNMDNLDPGKWTILLLEN